MINVSRGGALLAGRAALGAGTLIDVSMPAGRRRPPHLFRVRVVRTQKNNRKRERWKASRTKYLYGCVVLGPLPSV